MGQDLIPKVVLRWTPPRKRKRGSRKNTRHKIPMTELTEMGLSLGETGPGGEILSEPYVPSGTKWISNSHITGSNMPLVIKSADLSCCIGSVFSGNQVWNATE